MLTKELDYEIEILDLSTEGEGIGRVEGAAVFVPETVPGDRALIRLTEIKKNFARGKVRQLLSPSSYRVDPHCSYAKECGGCGLSAISYEGQLALKKKWVEDRLVRIGGIKEPKVLDVIPMEEPFRYRNKAQFPVGRVSGQEKKERGCNVGFHRMKSHDVVNCESCLLQAEPAERIAEVIRRYVKETKLPVYDPKTGTGVLRHVVVRTAFGTGQIMVILVATERRLPAVKELIDEIQAALEGLPGDCYLESLILNVNRAKGREVMGKECITLAGTPTIKDRLLGMEFEISPLSFYQVNPIQTEKLYAKAAEYAGLTGTETVLDLYCGVGAIGLYLARQAGKVIGIESVKAAVLDANRNAVINGIVNAVFICGKAEEELPKLLSPSGRSASEPASGRQEGQGDTVPTLGQQDGQGGSEPASGRQEAQGVQADVVILDPPRAGCAPELLVAAAAAGPQRIVYVSCDPATLARDLRILGGLGYEFVEAQPVDMFPWTNHVETVVLITRVKE